VLGLVLGTALAGLRELLDRKLRDEDQAFAAFELPVIATVPKPERATRTVLLENDRELEEAYGTLAANVVFADRAVGGGAFLITSPRSGDGKTSAAFGLARALRTLGRQVIVVEADLHHPRFVEVWDLPQPGGLSSLLAGVGELEDELVYVDGGGPARRSDGKGGAGSLRVLPAGPVPPNPSAMLSRPTMGKVLQGCRELADFVLIDSAPVGLVHDPLTLVNHVDGVLVVARLDYTTRDAARQTRRLLTHMGAAVLGVVLTGAERITSYYGDPDARHYGRSQPKARAKPEKAAGRA
jgi:capsular exopolysaccharide synthesis family protein